MVQQHKDGAADAAGQRAAELERARDTVGQAVRLRKAATVEELQRGSAEGEAVN
jgi:hypothetical protein